MQRCKRQVLAQTSCLKTHSSKAFFAEPPSLRDSAMSIITFTILIGEDDGKEYAAAKVNADQTLRCWHDLLRAL